MHKPKIPNDWIQQSCEYPPGIWMLFFIIFIPPVNLFSLGNTSRDNDWVCIDVMSKKKNEAGIQEMALSMKRRERRIKKWIKMKEWRVQGIPEPWHYSSQGNWLCHATGTFPFITRSMLKKRTIGFITNTILSLRNLKYDQ